MPLLLKIKMYDCYMMYTNASEASTAFGKLRSFLISSVNRGVDERGLFYLNSLLIKEKNSKVTRVAPMALSIATLSSSTSLW